MAVKVIVNNDRAKIQKQIQALEWQIKHDTDDKSRQIHKEALKQLKQKIK